MTRKWTPEERARWRRLKEEHAAVRAEFQAVLDRVDERMRVYEEHRRAEAQRRERRRQRLRRLIPFAR